MKKSIYWLAITAALGVSQTSMSTERVSLSFKPNQLNANLSDSKTQAINKQLELDTKHQFTLISSTNDAKGNSHYRYSQSFNGIPIWGQHLLVHANQKSGKSYLSGDFLKNIELSQKQVQASISPPKVIEMAKNKLSQLQGIIKQINRQTASKIIYFDPAKQRAVLAYQIELYVLVSRQQPVRQIFIIDANNGEVYLNWDALMHAEISGPGGNQKTGQYTFGPEGTYPALVGEEDNNNNCRLENDNVRAVNLNHSEDTSDNTPFEFTCYENTFKAINGAFSPINDAFFFGNITHDMYNNWYQDPPLSSQIRMKVHYGNNLPTAFWDGQSVIFGDGNDDFYPMVDVNLSAHEISHGFTETNSALINLGEAAAINESFSDIAGEAAEFYWKNTVDWAVSADILKNKDGLRFFDDPESDDVSIAHFDQYVEGMDPHLASGIFNHAFYLLATTPNWDVRKAFDVFVTANKAYWTPQSTFESAGCGLFMAASDLEYEWLDVYKALLAVGVRCRGNAIDADADEMSDITEMVYGFDPADPADADADFDQDGLSNLVELSYDYNAKDRDTDNDGLTDSAELDLHATSVVDPDTDDDGMTDGWELTYQLDPLLADDALSDKDGDGNSNLQEFIDQTDPTDANSLVPPTAPHDGIYDLENGEAIPSTFISPGADGSFSINNLHSFSGTLSLANDDIADGQLAALEWTINLPDPGYIQFNIKTSTEKNRDVFSLLIDSVDTYQLSGEQDWQAVKLPLTQGAHNIVFQYLKDSVNSVGDDRVWIDDLTHTGLLFDLDGDGMHNDWESFFGFDPERAHDSTGDPDEDGLTNLQEYLGYTNPILADSDSDGLNDIDEINSYLTDPINADSDGDQINDGLEIELSLNPLNAADGLLDMDNDGINNQTEAKYLTLLNDATSSPVLLTYLTNDFSDSLSTNWDQTMPDNWLIESSPVAEGEEANKQLFAAPIGNNSEAQIDYVNVFDDGTLTFTVYTDSEANKDVVNIYLDDELFESISGEASQAISIPLNKGEHKISLIYRKNFALSTAKDRVSIDDFLFIAPAADSDNDGLTNSEELELGTKLDVADTDGDGLLDGTEVANGTDPKLEDTDRDGVSDLTDAYPLDSTRWDESGRWTDTSGGGAIYFLIPLLVIAVTSRKRISMRSA